MAGSAKYLMPSTGRCGVPWGIGTLVGCAKEGAGTYLQALRNLEPLHRQAWRTMMGTSTFEGVAQPNASAVSGMACYDGHQHIGGCCATQYLCSVRHGV
eukprot:1158006-Pelagomonas_calceolata.AAC.26